MSEDPLLEAVRNLSRDHREHEKHHAAGHKRRWRVFHRRVSEPAR